MTDLQVLIFLPIIAGSVLFLLPESIKIVKGIISLLVSLVTFFYSYLVFKVPSVHSGWFSGFGLEKFFVFNVDALSRMISLFIGFFGVLFLLYSLAYITRKKRILSYYSYYLITLGSAYGAVFADHFLLFIFFWGMLGLTLFKLIKGYDEKSSEAAKKSLILIGASDSFIILGIAILGKMTGTYRISEISVITHGYLGITAFLCLLIGSLTKAGAFPVHTWIPDYVEKAPASSSAFLPASLDKLLGIYLLARLVIDVFVITGWARLLLLLIGVTTIIAAVMMALVQHNYKKLLGYHAVSQVGYMITGLGLGTPLGIAGGLFHMINHALYKSGLFLTAGSIEKRTGKEELDDVGGLAKFMPLTFITALVCALSISGIPPFNGFASKWIIYQGIIDFGKGSGIANKLWIVWLILAVFGSALTLASFIKFISGIYLGRRKKEFEKVKEVSFLMWLPQIIIALVCIIFGVFAVTFAVPKFIAPAVPGKIAYIGIWKSQMVSFLILISIIVGYLIYLLGNIKKFRTEDSFIGGEVIREETNYPVGDFYKTISSFGFISFFYKKAEKKWFDIYNIGKVILGWFNHLFSEQQTGILPDYITWVIGGIAVLLFILL